MLASKDVRLRKGILMKPILFGGAFIVDPQQLAIVEIEEELMRVITSSGPEPVEPTLLQKIRIAENDGWLVVEGEL